MVASEEICNEAQDCQFSAYNTCELVSYLESWHEVKGRYHKSHHEHDEMVRSTMCGIEEVVASWIKNGGVIGAVHRSVTQSSNLALLWATWSFRASSCR
ncbi:hypothetical protein TNCV_4236331 [Trichonephila clavipes]|nr:hypothetical protein TNCV_4236331 [Trichonephila clavipes]